MIQKIRNCQNCKNEFVIEPEDFDFYEKIKVPPPTFCPECRLKRRLAWRNERFLYRRICSRCEQPVISVFSESINLKVYCNKCWWGDEWDGLDYGVDFDPNKPFLLQLRELFQKVPVLPNYSIYTTMINSEYNNMAAHLKNCYLTTYSDFNEDCAYGSFILYSKTSIDNLMISKCELCYECVNCRSCYNAFYSLDCETCNDVYFCRNCIGCSECFGCINLRHQKYHIFNKPFSKEDYKRHLQELYLGLFSKREKVIVEARQLWSQFPQKFIHERHNNNVSGEYIYDSKNTLDSYLCFDMEDSRFCYFLTEAKDCYDCSNYATASELLYEILQCGNHTARILFSWWACNNCYDVEYSMFPINCRNVFGCVGLKKKEYCILNKQYNKDEYERLRQEIINQMNNMPYQDKIGNTYKYGEFFPAELSPFGYNETTTQEYFPLTKQQALEQGYNWKNHEPRNYQIDIKTENLPDHIKDVQDDILGKVIECANYRNSKSKMFENLKIENSLEIENWELEIDSNPKFTNCTTAFKIIPDELAFYRRMNLPLPRLCPNCRHYERLKQRNPLKLWHRKCQCAGLKSEARSTKSETFSYTNTIAHFHGQEPCPNEFETSYAPDRSEIVYCEKCYQAEVV